jgi:hypothetical protein
MRYIICGVRVSFGALMSARTKRRNTAMAIIRTTRLHGGIAIASQRGDA